MIEITEELKNLAELFKKYEIKLYLVGGVVRDGYLGIKNYNSDDIDICSSATPKMIEYMLEGTGFTFSYLNKQLGVMAIKGEKVYEHATFRKEVYSNDKHNPNSVAFIKHLSEDVERRDFKINAVYYDILENRYVDPLGGIEDLKKKVLTTTKPAKIVFNDDPERILRLIRFSTTLGFKIPENELEYAKKNAYKVQGLSKGRIRREFEKLIKADMFYPDYEPSKNSHIESINMLEEFDIMQYILPLLHELKNSNKMTATGEKLYNRALRNFKMAKPENRLTVLILELLQYEKEKLPKPKFYEEPLAILSSKFNSVLNKFKKPKKDKTNDFMKGIEELEEYKSSEENVETETSKNNKKGKKEKEVKFDEEAFVDEIIRINFSQEGLNYPPSVLDKMKKTVLGYYFEKTMFVSIKDVRRFIYYNVDAIESIIELKNNIKYGVLTDKENKKRRENIELLKSTYKQMLEENVIFDKEELNINGEELIRSFPKIKLELLEEFKNDIAAKLAEDKNENNKETLIVMANKVINSKRDYYLED